MTRAAVVALVLAACSGGSSRPAPAPVRGPEPLAPVREAAPEPAPAVQPVASAGVKVSLEDVGLEGGLLDRGVDPCIDFYQFACGGWLASHPPPPDRARVSRFTEVDDRNQQVLRAILEDAASGVTADAGSVKLGNFYASCVDEAAVDKAGLAALKPLLARTLGIKDTRTWQAALLELHKLGIPAVFQHVVLPDLRTASQNVTYLDAAGLTLPDRDSYSNRALLDGLRQHAAKLLALAGAPGDAADVVAIEAAIAELSKTAAEQRDLAGIDNPTDVRALAKQVTSVDWPRYFAALGGPPSKRIVIATPKLFAGFDKLRAQFKPAQWSAYFTFQLLHHLAPALPSAFGAQAFELDKLITGVEQPRERTQRCAAATGAALADLLAQPYLARTFPGNARQDATRIVDALVTAMAAELASVDWLSDTTRQAASLKLGKLARLVGFPERWRSYDFEVRRGDHLGNTLRAAAFAARRERMRAGKPVDRSEWHMNAFDLGAYYNPSVNHLVLPASMLQRPFFGPDRAVPVNLGGIGEMIGHELTHAFDDHGAQFDGDGNRRSWWPPEDEARFRERTRCVAEQYATFEVLPKKFVSAPLTLGEDIADLGGVRVAFAAYRALRKGAAKTYVADGFGEDQQFFLAVGQASCQRDRPAEAERRLQVDPHAPAKFRVYGALRNMPEFADAFQCAAGTPMRPTKPCAVW